MHFAKDARIVVRALERYLRSSRERFGPVINQRPLPEIVRDLELADWAERGGLTGRGLARFIDRYLARTTRLHHPAYLAHQVAVPHPYGSLGSLVDGFTNNAMAIYEMGPAAAAIEYFVINWLLAKVGWPPSPYPGPGGGAGGGGPGPTGNGRQGGRAPGGEPAVHGGGVLTHGGSLANLTALIAARSRLAPQVWETGNPPDLALLAPAGSHYSIARAAGILGLGRRGMYDLQTDARGVVLPDRLPEAWRRLKNDGRRAIALVANACSTSLGLYDPLGEIGAFCAEHGLWFHVDGAHGAGALLSAEHRGRLRGVERADSLVWDAHKLLRAPTVCAAVLVRDRRSLDRAFQQEASYLFHNKEQPGFDFIHRTVECTKAGLGLRFFAVLAALGERGLAGYVDRQFRVTREAHELLQGLPEFEVAAEPQSNILCFRLRGDDELQMRVRARLLAEGSFYLSTTAHAERRWLRLVFMNPDTELQDIRRLVERLRALAEEASRGQTNLSPGSSRIRAGMEPM
jgi:L-2,4-diaminobutyrate decarboxylase